jgi:hypothetical protein
MLQNQKPEAQVSKTKPAAPVSDPRLEAIVRSGVHILHEFPGGVVSLYSTKAPLGFAAEVRRNLKANVGIYQGDSFPDAYGAFLAATDAEIIRQGGKLETIQS